MTEDLETTDTGNGYQVHDTVDTGSGYLALTLQGQLTGDHSGDSLYIADNNDELIEQYDASTEFDLSTLSFSQSFDVSSEETDVSGIAWNLDGTKMFTCGFSNDNIYEYSLSTAYDISTASFVDSFDISGESIAPEGVIFNDDGTKVYIAEFSDDEVVEYGLSTAFDISTASLNQQAGLENTPSAAGIAWNPDGTKLYVGDDGGGQIMEYALSTAYDPSTNSLSTTLDVSSKEGNPEGLAWNRDGSKIFLGGRDSDSVHSYSLSTAFDISTGSFNQSFNTGRTPRGMAWKGHVHY